MVTANSLTRQYSAVKLVYDVYGKIQSSRSPLFLVHGLFGHRKNVVALAESLYTVLNTQVVTVDLRNHGNSPHSTEMSMYHLVADLEHLIESYIRESNGHTKKVNLLGHSMGGRVASFLVGHRPDLIDRLILEDCSPKCYQGKKNSMILINYLDAMERIICEINNCNSLDQAKSMADVLLQQEVKDACSRRCILTNLIQEADGSFAWKLNLQAIRVNVEHLVGYPSEFQRFHGSTLVISSWKSPYILVEDKSLFHERFSNLTFKTIHNAGHWIHHDQPEVFIDLVRNHLSRHEFARS